jgi:hypothetical protein
MRRGRLLLLLGNVALFAGWVAKFRPNGVNTWSDGH